jgi:ABC-type uncharacterized transport system substrate-binding protein
MGGSAFAHPHVWVTMKSELVYAADGSLTGIRHHWTFDDMFSAFATEGLQGKVKGQFSREELAPLAQVNVESLKEYGYFTFANADGKKVAFGDPLPGYWLDYKNAILTLNFTLPLKQAVKAKFMRIEVYDPTIFVDFEFAKEAPVSLIGPHPACKLDVVLPQQITSTQSATLGEQFFNALTKAQNWGERYSNKILVNCP